jgi:hypothetical protein
MDSTDQGASASQQTASPFGSSSGPHATVAQPSNQPWDYSGASQFPPMNDPSTPPTPPAMSRSYLTPPVLSGWDPNSPSLWHKPAERNIEFPVPNAIDDDRAIAVAAQAGHKGRRRLPADW